MNWSVFDFSLLVLSSCGNMQLQNAQGNWIKGTEQEKIETIENGLERRPKRAKSAEHFLNESLHYMEQALSIKYTAVFNRCHAMEKVPAFTVQIPDRRLSPIKHNKE